MLFADIKHLENSIKRSYVEQALQDEHFRLTGHSH